MGYTLETDTGINRVVSLICAACIYGCYPVVNHFSDYGELVLDNTFVVKLLQKREALQTAIRCAVSDHHDLRINRDVQQQLQCKVKSLLLLTLQCDCLQNQMLCPDNMLIECAQSICNTIKSSNTHTHDEQKRWQ